MMMPVGFDADMAEYVGLLSEMGVPSEDRDRLTDRLRYIAELPADSPSRVFELVAHTVELVPFLESYVRDGGAEELADFYARVGLAYSLWLEMPTELAKFAGFPNPKARNHEDDD
jgi:hypothetical protein